MKKLESTFLNMFLSLTIISLVAGAGLAAVYNMTEEPIAQANLQKQQQAIAAVLPEGAQVAGEAEVINENNVYMATDKEGKPCMAVEVNTNGFGGNIKMMIGFDSEGALVDYSVLELAETPGLGSKLTTWFREKGDVRGAKVADGEVAVSKDGGKYDAITAATISSRAFMKAVNSAMQTYTMAMEADAESAATPQVAADSTAVANDSIKTEEAEL